MTYGKTMKSMKHEEKCLQKRKTDWLNFTFIDLFAGIGGIRIGFEALGGKCVFSSEWDKYAQLTYANNFGETPQGDITKIDERDILDHDILLAGFPCQPFSIMGDKKGFSDTRGSLFFDIERILELKRPPALLLENVKMFKTHDKGRTFKTVIKSLEKLGYQTHTTILNALNFGLAQKRERTFIVGFQNNLEFKFPKPYNKQANLKDFLEPDNQVDKSLYASDKIIKKRKEKLKIVPFYPSIWHENKGGNISVLPYSCALRAGASYNYLLVNGVRRLSTKEMLRLQGFPEDFKVIGPMGQIRKQLGNSVPVNVINEIAKEMLNSLRIKKIYR